MMQKEKNMSENSTRDLTSHMNKFEFSEIIQKYYDYMKSLEPIRCVDCQAYVVVNGGGWCGDERISPSDALKQVPCHKLCAKPKEVEKYE